MAQLTLLEKVALRYGPASPFGEQSGERLVRELLGADPDDWQIAGLRAFSRGERKISIRSGHGPGKTTLVAWFIWIQALTRYPQKTVATAPTGGQLEGALLAEVVKWGDHLPKPILELFEVKSKGVYLKKKPKLSFFEARTSRAETPEALQGIHQDPGYVLIIADEASGIAEQVYEAAVGSMSQANAQTVLVGNPVRTSGTFFDSHHRLKRDYFTLWVGYWPDEKTRPPGMFHSKRMTAEFAEEVARKYGEKSNAFRVRVLGQFPAADDDTVIPFEYVEGAHMREIAMLPNADEVWGLDVARQGRALTVLIRRTKRAVLPDIEYWGGMDLMYTAGRVKLKWDQTLPSQRPKAILVDSNGLGAGVADRLYELGLPVYDVNTSEASAYKDRYQRLRDQLWFECRDWLSKLNVTLPVPDEGDRDCPFGRLAAELVTPRYKISSGGKLQVESKDDMLKRGFDSPNFADALVLTFADEPALAQHGSEPQRDDGGGHYKWNEELPKRRRFHD
jgi:hypothetical protein